LCWIASRPEPGLHSRPANRLLAEREEFGLSVTVSSVQGHAGAERHCDVPKVRLRSQSRTRRSQRSPELNLIACCTGIASARPSPPQQAQNRGLPGTPEGARLQRKPYRLLNWNRFRAPFWPYFLRSLARGSRRRKPSDFSFPRSSGLKRISARAMPMRTAPACPFTPPPDTVATTLKLPAVSLSTSGWRA